jgi:hypothetical protein
MDEKIKGMLSQRKLPDEIYNSIEKIGLELIELREKKDALQKKYETLNIKILTKPVKLVEKQIHMNMQKKGESYRENYEKAEKELELFANKVNIDKLNEAFRIFLE